MKSCTRCILTNQTPGVLIDKNGICNVCQEWDKHAEQLTDYPKLKEIFQEKMEETRGKFPYDALVGMSGGKDGVYVAYALKRFYGLKVLGVTVDYGFMPNDFAKSNVDHIVQTLGIDHKYIKVRPDLVKKLIGGYLNFPTNISPCHMCTTVLGTALAYKLAVDMQVPKLLTGLDRGQLFSKLHLTHVQKRVFQGLDTFDNNAATEESSKILEKLHSYFEKLGLDKKEREMVLPNTPLLKDSEQTPELVNYFLFHPYDEARMKDIIAKELGWTRPSQDEIRGHFDCELKTAAACATTELGLGERLAFELSVDIREGKIPREDCLSYVKNVVKKNKTISSPYEEVEKVLGIPEKTFQRKIKRLSRIAPIYSFITNTIFRIFGKNRWTEKLIFLIRPH